MCFSFWFNLMSSLWGMLLHIMFLNFYVLYLIVIEGDVDGVYDVI